MSQEQAQVLNRGVNCAVVQLAGRAFPGIHVQGDTFAEIWMQLANAARTLREARNGEDPGNREDPGNGETPDNSEALDDLDYAIGELKGFLSFYEATLSERGIRRPY
ncbi:DUF6959 family protein [Micromonospora profundi]|uniref:DUF6959 family protein n=1 Tax=Micromonospora profundi TaxID=1420889 RepID=UPI003669970B